LRAELDYEVRNVVGALTMQEVATVVERDRLEPTVIERFLSELGIDNAIDRVSRTQDVQSWLTQS
jgi:hypothetical protein